MKVGDRVKNIRVSYYKLEPAVIVEISEKGNTLRYLVEYLGVFNTSGTKMTTWVSEDDIMLDIEFYRDEKIKEILTS